MGVQLHKRFEDVEVVEIFERYLGGEIEAKVALVLLGISRSRFFDLLKGYQSKPDAFTIKYQRDGTNNRVDDFTEKKILKELSIEAKLIADKDNPVQDYNYSFIRDTLEKKHDIDVCLSTVIRRAKKMGFIKKRSSRRSTTAKY